MAKELIRLRHNLLIGEQHQIAVCAPASNVLSTPPGAGGINDSGTELGGQVAWAAKA